MMKRFLSASVGALALAAMPAGANILVPPTGTVSPDELTLGAGSTLEASIVGAPFVSSLGASDFSGTYSAFVFRDTTNTFGAGDLAFEYQFNSATGSGEDINRTTASSFTGFSTDVGFILGAGIIPDSVDRTSPGPVGFNFISGVLPGSGSVDLLIETNATLFKPGNISFINDGTSTNAAFGPAVPEPKTWAMLGIGFALLAVFGFRRKRAARFAF